MNYIYKYISGLILVTSIIFTGCKKQLDLVPLNQVSSETYWKTPDDAIKFATYAYTFLPNQNSVYYEAYSDNAYSKSTGVRIFGNGTYTALNTSNNWSYAPIRHCLIFLRDVEKVPNLDASLKKRLIGEVKFILAFRYFLLTTFYRDVPLVEKVFETGQEADIPKTPKAQITAKIITWLNEAADGLPTTYPAADNGRITKGAAYALLSRIYLYNSKYSEAASEAKKAMDLNIYRLYQGTTPDPKQDYFNFFQEMGDYSSEDILSYGYYGANEGANTLRNILGSILVIGNNLVNPSANLVSDYESDLGYYPYTNDPRYTPTAPFENRDPRMRQTLYYPGTYETVNPANPEQKQFDPFNSAGDKIGADQGTNTGFSWTKNVQRTAYPIYSGANNWKILRYAEVLLNFAEATNEISGPTTDVITALDKIRERAGMPTVAATFALRATGISQSTMRDFIRHERRIELAGDGLRYFDILRWKIGEEVLNGPIYTIDASAGINAISTAGGKVNTYPKTVIENRVFTAKNYIWPIPQSAIDASKGILMQADEWK